MWKYFSHCVQCTVSASPVASDFALARKARLVHGIPLAIYEGFVVFKTIKHTHKTIQWVFTKVLLGPNGHKSPQEAIHSPCAGVSPKQPKPSNTSNTFGLCQKKRSMEKRVRLLSKKDNHRTPRTVWGIQRGKGERAGVRGQGARKGNKR